MHAVPTRGILKTETPKKKSRFRQILKKSTTVVTFQNCAEIREYERILDARGNNRPVLALGWRYTPEHSFIPLLTDTKPKRKYGPRMALTGKECLDLCMKYGFSKQEILLYTEKIDLNVCRKRKKTLVDAQSTSKKCTRGKSESRRQPSQSENSQTRFMQNEGLEGVDPALLFDVVEVRKNEFDSLPGSLLFELELSTLQTTTQHIEVSLSELGLYVDEISRSLQERFLTIVSCS